MVSRNTATFLGCAIIGFICYINVRQLQSMEMGRAHIVRAPTRYAVRPRLEVPADLDLDGVVDSMVLAPVGVGIGASVPAHAAAACLDDASAGRIFEEAVASCAAAAAPAEGDTPPTAPTQCAPRHVDEARAKRLQRLAGDDPAAWPAGCDGGADSDPAMCDLVRRVAQLAPAGGARELVLTVVSESAAHTHALPLHTAALRRAGLAERTVLAPLGCRSLALARAAIAARAAGGLYDARADGAAADGAAAAGARWAITARFLATGTAVLLLEPTVVLAADPFPLFARDHDLEAASTGWSEQEAYGYVHGTDDPSMGWSRYVESMRIMAISPALLMIQPTRAAHELADVLSERLGGAAGAALVSATAAAAEGAAAPAERAPALVERRLLNEEAILPAAKGTNRVGVRYRVLDYKCFRAAAAVARLQAGAAESAVAFEIVVPPAPLGASAAAGGAEASAAADASARACDVLTVPRTPALLRGTALPAERWPAAWHEAKTLGALERQLVDKAMQSRRFESWAALGTADGSCERQPGRAGVRTQPLNLIAPRGAGEWPTNCAGLEDLCSVLAKAATTGEREVLVAVSNKNIFRMLGTFIDGLKAAKVRAFVLVALDDETAAFGAERGVHTYLRKVTARGGGTDNHATSGLKFRILKEFLTVGCSVLLSDVDIIYTDDPFRYLYRDADVEGMSDGWDDATAYGDAEYTTPDAALSWLGPHASVRVFARNSGLFYLQATHESLALMERMAHRMATESVWDQSAYSQELFRPSSPVHAGVGTLVRVMAYECFLNTKVLFRFLRPHPKAGVFKPVSAHVNYHPEKEDRMIDIAKRYNEGQVDALERWNSGEGLRDRSASGSCVGKIGMGPDEDVHRLREGEASPERRLASAVAQSDRWQWNGVEGVRFKADGALTLEQPIEAGGSTEGVWGVVDNRWRKLDTLWAELGGKHYLLVFLRHNWSFVAIRCADEWITYGQHMAPIPERVLY